MEYNCLLRSLVSCPDLIRASIALRKGWIAGSSPAMTEERRGSVSCRLGKHAHDVALLHDQEFLAVELDLGARPFAEQHAIANLEVDRDQLATFVAAARTYRRDFALRRLFLGAVGNDDAALGLFFGVDTLDHDAVMQRTKFGFSHDGSFEGLVCWSVCHRNWNKGVFAPVA